MLWCEVVCCGMMWYSVVWFGMVWYDVVWSGMEWYGVVWWCGVVVCGGGVWCVVCGVVW